MLLKDLQDRKIIHPPSWLPDNTVFLAVVGSNAYGTATDTSDFDIFGIAIPKKESVFPHLAGVIQGFGTQIEQFNQWPLKSEKSKCFDPDALGGKGREYDFTIHNIVKYFQLCMENNANCLDTLFVPYECILHSTQVGNMIRENRKLFLSKECLVKFKGYAFGQMHKMRTKEPTGKRKKTRDAFGYDTKFAMHLVRLLGECEQILTIGEIDLRRNNEHHKAIRRGEVPQEEVIAWAQAKERQLEELAVKSDLPQKADEKAIKQLLLNCLEHHYGSLKEAIVVPDNYLSGLREIKQILDKIGV